MSACGGSSGTNVNTPNSSDLIYANASPLGAIVNSSFTDSSPEISSNGLELYFHSDRDGQFDLWVSTRTSVLKTWGAATNLGPTINSTSDDKAPDISDDGLTLIFASDRPDAAGDFDLYVSTRATLNDPWLAPMEVAGLINTTSIESDPSLSSDGLTLFFHSDSPGFGNTDLYVSTRPSITNDWAMPVNLGIDVNSTGFDSAPEISSDGLTLYFHSTRDARGLGPENIWRVTRTRSTGDWARPTALPTPVNTTSSEVAPSLSNDWQTLYFSSSASGNGDIWQATP